MGTLDRNVKLTSELYCVRFLVFISTLPRVLPFIFYFLLFYPPENGELTRQPGDL